MKHLVLILLAAVAFQAHSLEYDPNSPVEKARALGEKELISTPSQIPAQPFLDEEAEDAFKTDGKKVKTYGFEMLRLGRGTNAFFYREGWVCMNDRALKGFLCYGKDADHDDRIWIFATSYSGRTMDRRTKDKTFGTVYQVDCGYEAIRSLRDYASDDHFGKGNTHSFEPSAKDGEWHFPRRSSAEAVLTDAVCKGASLIPETRINGTSLFIQNNVVINH